MEIKRIITGAFETNTYILTKENKTILIDPAGSLARIQKELGDKKLIAIILTHGHFDHIKAVDDLVALYGVDVYLNQADEKLARSKIYNSLMGISATIKCPIKHIKEGELVIDNFTFEAIYAPGHTEGSTMLIIGKHAFVGDVVFKESVGRTDLYSGDERKMKDSLRKFTALDPFITVYPGHGDITNVAYELQNNPFLKYLF